MTVHVLFTAHSRRASSGLYHETWTTRGVYDSAEAAHRDGVTHAWGNPDRRYRVEACDLRSVPVLERVS
jgi:hypothetical protein